MLILERATSRFRNDLCGFVITLDHLIIIISSNITTIIIDIILINIIIITNMYFSPPSVFDLRSPLDLPLNSDNDQFDFYNNNGTS